MYLISLARTSVFLYFSVVYRYVATSGKSAGNQAEPMHSSKE